MKKNWKSIIGLIIVLIIMVIIGIQLFPIFAQLGTEEGRISFEQDIEELGIKGVGLILGLMIIQIFLPILPGEPIEFLAGIVFGPIQGLLIILLGILISTSLIILIVKLLGKKFLYSIVEKEKLDKFENHKLFKNPRKVYTLLFLLFLIPGTPKDLFVYLGAILPLNPWKFLVIATVSRIPSVISSTIAGGQIAEGNWWGIALVYGITLVVAGIIIFIARKQDKDLKEVMDIKE